MTLCIERLLTECRAKKITIITTWKLKDIQFGSSELELYEFCRKNKIYLFINNRVHLKVFINDYSSCVFGSPNVSEKGLALVDNHNYELATKVDKLDINLIIYFKKILTDSILVDDEIHKKYKEELAKLEPLQMIAELNVGPRSDFLISSLPMSYNVDEFFEVYSTGFINNSKERIECALHDILLYNIPFKLGKEDFINLLKRRFFESKFIVKLINFIGDEKYFGQVKEWIQNNCEDVPVPSRRDLTGNIQVLYKWLVSLSDGKYDVDRPNYSQRIYRVK